MGDFGKPFLKKYQNKLKKKQKINVKTPHVNKNPLTRNGNLAKNK